MASSEWTHHQHHQHSSVSSERRMSHNCTAVSGHLSALANVRLLFYLVTPSESSFPSLELVPPYVDMAMPYFILMATVELMVGLKKRRVTRVNDTVCSLSAGILSQVTLLFGRSLELIAYIWVHQNFCIVELPWDSPWTWGFTFLGLDFCFYWFHRASHECSLLWATHQVHHSSEAYNLSTALRQSISHRFLIWVFYTPLALFVPTPVFLVHVQLNLLYQFWIHTEFIPNLGPLEWVLNTPSHHRVHHGRNPYCIDKNYGGVFIVFDRMFNTFAAERPEERMAYSLVHPLESFDPINAQMCHFIYLWSHLRRQRNWKDCLKALAYGPGWDIGKPRLGDPADIPEIPKRSSDSAHPFVYNPRQSIFVTMYSGLHFLVTLGLFLFLVSYKSRLTFFVKLFWSAFIALSLIVIGNLFDPRDMRRGLFLELGRLLCVGGIWIWTEVSGVAILWGNVNVETVRIVTLLGLSLCSGAWLRMLTLTQQMPPQRLKKLL